MNSVTSFPHGMIAIFLTVNVFSSLTTFALGTFLSVQVDRGISTGLQKPLQRLETGTSLRNMPVCLLATELATLTLEYYLSLWV